MDTSASIVTHQVTHERPIPIALVDLGGLLPVKIKRLAKDLNRIKHQRLFRFHAVAKEVRLPKRTLPHAYTLNSLYTLIKESLEGSGYTFGIGITHEVLEDARFNWHDEGAGVGVITLDQADVYSPKGRTLYQYLAYLTLCEALCITGKTQFEHGERNYCLFDMCIEKSDLTKCLSNPFIHCPTSLTEVGFTQEDVKSANTILAYVKKPSFSVVFRHTFTNPLVSIIFGVLVKSIAEVVFSLPPCWNIEINLALFLIIILLWLREYRTSSR